MFIRIGIMTIFLGAMMGENETLVPAMLTMAAGTALLVAGAYIERAKTRYAEKKHTILTGGNVHGNNRQQKTR